jgi:hypothetical protein
MVLRNTHLGKPIETDHNLLVLLPTRTCKHWKLAARTVATPTPMSTEIDNNIDWYDDCLWSIDLSIRKSKDVPAAGIPNTDAYSARVDRWVKPRTAATPRVGWPVFDTSQPAPPTSNKQFQPRQNKQTQSIFRPFGVWLHHPRSGPQCRSVRPHELTQLIGLDNVHPMFEALPYEN